MENTNTVSKKEACRNELVQRAGELAMYYYREKGFHCPEATIRACSDALDLRIPEDVIRAASGFMGGGGGMGERCGVVEAGCMILPPVLTFYNKPADITAQIDHILGKALMPFGLMPDTFRPWLGIT